ncbi:MAG TPA: glycine--tRNA ligase [Candidatus Saccharimonadales bacterium]|nr:glycine--tRNA ligase [Candidatus Saccharimonadales bacterium]
MTEVKLEDIVSLAKRRGFIYPGSEIYGGLAGTYDYGPLGIALKRNITNLWWKMFVEDREDMYGIDSTIVMNPDVWVASGHVATFNDPLIEDVKTKKRYRLDHLLEEQGVEDVDAMTLEQMAQVIKDRRLKSPDGNELGAPAQFNMMFKTHVGPVEDDDSVAYLRPETAQGMFTNFKNVVDSFYPDLPFGLAQIGRSFRNEISPGNFIFRLRELEIMELEYFIHPGDWEGIFDAWLAAQHEWFEKLGLDASRIKEHEVPEADRAHYSKRTVDCFYDFPSLGFSELAGLAYRTDFDLKSHQEHSGKNLEYRPKDGGEAFVPHVIEPTFGLDRHVMAVLSNAYTEDEVNGEKRIYLKLPAHLAPVKVAVLPLAKNKPELVAKAREVYAMLKKELGSVMWVDTGNIGKNYRKMDEIGVPYCVTVDFDTLEGETAGTVTVRHRDTTEQKRVTIESLTKELRGHE